MEKKVRNKLKICFMLLALTAIVILRYVILPEYTKSATSEVKISPAELNTLQVKAKITTVLYKVEKMKMTEACQLLSKISEREVKPSFFDSYPSKRDFLDVVGLYLESFVKRGGENIKVPIEYWIQTYCNAAIKYARPVINATNIFVAVWTETSYPDVSKLKLLQTEGNKETWYFPLHIPLQAYFIKKTEGASWLSGEHYIGDSPEFIRLKPRQTR